MNYTTWEQRVRKVEPYTPGEQPKTDNVIKLNTNENPFPPSPMVEKVIKEYNEDALRLYPDTRAGLLVDALAKRYGVDSDQVFVGVGSDDVISQTFLTFFNSDKEMMWIGGGAGMAPLRAQIMHLTKTLHITDRTMNYFYGARALNEVFYLEDFLQIEKDFPNFKFHLALDRPDPAADAAGVSYTAGFVHQVIYETYLKNHEAPEDIEYYMCGPGPMSNAVVKMLDSLGVEPSSIMYDNFGG